jgi:hypothetical protein
MLEEGLPETLPSWLFLNWLCADSKFVLVTVGFVAADFLKLSAIPMLLMSQVKLLLALFRIACSAAKFAGDCLKVTAKSETKSSSSRWSGLVLVA